PAKKSMTFLALAALGVVFGDIGTSPLYSFQTALWSLSDPDQSSVLGIVSLIIWCLLLLVTLKYVFVVMRADYHGEGGVFALLALLQERLGHVDRLKPPLYTLLLLFGAALLFGDGTITPAISVLSAMEGLESVNPKLMPFVVPGTVGILAVLFSIQRFGTGQLGIIFGWVMLVWFVVLGAMGFVWIMRNPSILRALNPFYALQVLNTDGWSALRLMGAVILAVTGVEALYADMGHFGRKAISLAWHVVALPALALNYLGQGALAMHTVLHCVHVAPLNSIRVHLRDFMWICCE
ncbi:MAG: KUP/HAK/KT family potassium transporter, partial [Terrimicrobiaceae bacterium]